MKKDKNNLIEPELSYKLMGICFNVYNILGAKYQEKYYQRAVEVELKKEKISYQKEMPYKLEYKGESIGRYFFDFLIENKVILELKTVPSISKKDIGQLLRYLKESNLKLGIIVNFGKEKVEYKRIINNSRLIGENIREELVNK